jgi:hypothetical protein
MEAPSERVTNLERNRCLANARVSVLNCPRLHYSGQMVGRVRELEREWWRGFRLVSFALVLAACGTKSHGSAHGQGGDTAGGSANEPSDPTIAPVRQVAVDKVDILLTIDNSSSMKDKQELLARSLPYLIERLISPRCVRDCTAADNCTDRQAFEGIPTTGNADGTGRCAQGHAEMAPIRDLHVGVISSSLGSHGAQGAQDLCISPGENDHAQLLGSVRNVSGTFNDLGFLAWDVTRRPGSAGADVDPAVFSDKVQGLVESAGEGGCELEATLEAWYRFLIDPEPPVEVVTSDGAAQARGIDETLLAQRASFLRPDSLVVIGILSDENDCSVIDEGYGWLVASQQPVYAGTSACADNPNDPCCLSCVATDVPAGCPDPAEDSNCLTEERRLPPENDSSNVRCWQQKARYGMDLLYPIDRYRKGLTSRLVADRSGRMVLNPLFAAPDGQEPRDPGFVHLMAIVGVPWQDIADDRSLEGDSLRFLIPVELDHLGRWDVVLGDPTASPPIPPSDPFMREAVAERGGENPITFEQTVPATSQSPRASKINGHEHLNVADDQLQYACTFPLAAPRPCDAAGTTSCACSEADIAKNSALCQPPAGGASGSTQYYAGGYPGTRFLQLIKNAGQEIGSSVASICPKSIDESSPSYGYLPAMNGLASSIREQTRPRCFPRALPVTEDGSLDGCKVLTTLPSDIGGCDCFGQGFSEASSSDLAKVKSQLELALQCDTADTGACGDVCVCQIPELQGSDLQGCQNDAVAPERPGFCYINAQRDEPNIGNPELIADCSPDSKRLLRFIGGTPPRGSQVFVRCEQPLFGP